MDTLTKDRLLEVTKQLFNDVCECTYDIINGPSNTVVSFVTPCLFLAGFQFTEKHVCHI